ncbi:MAG: cytochrome c biogenesis protein CcsA [Deltaproteobacteria bacterium]|nr:cytochrome c biogenesis protein CcsA [Deltaproteobacteria bacterium]
MSQLSFEFLALTFVAYLIATFLFTAYLRNLSWSFAKLARWFLAFGLLLHLGELFTLLHASGHYFPTNSQTSLLTVTALISAICFFLSFRKSRLILIVILLPMISAALVALYFISDASAATALPSPWLWTHILSILLGEALFCLAAASSIIYLVVESRLKHRQVSKFFARVPALPDIDKFLNELLSVGFALLSLGMLLGFFFAREYWSPGWILDPKVLFCLLTWLVFAFILIFRIVSKSFRGRRSSQATVLGFVLIVFLTWGVDFFFHSQHQNFRIENKNP